LAFSYKAIGFHVQILETDGDLLGVIVRFDISLGADDYLMGGLKSRV